MRKRVLGVVRSIRIFFFQAEDGIRDLTVTGVQTCALPISAPQNNRALRQAAFQALVQVVRKQRVITEPLARVIERDQQGIEVSQLLKEILADRKSVV